MHWEHKKRKNQRPWSCEPSWHSFVNMLEIFFFFFFNSVLHFSKINPIFGNLRDMRLEEWEKCWLARGLALSNRKCKLFFVSFYLSPTSFLCLTKCLTEKKKTTWFRVTFKKLKGLTKSLWTYRLRRGLQHRFSRSLCLFVTLKRNRV